MEDIVLSSTSSSTTNPQEETNILSGRTIWVNGPVIVGDGPVIVGAGPSGLAVGACLREQGVPFVIVDRADCIASLWQNRTYDRLKLHLPKEFCQLPRMPFPDDFPEYPTRKQFISYLESYASKFEINPHLNESVQWARYDEALGLWRVKTVRTEGTIEYVCRWVVVATGENAEKVVPEIEGVRNFSGRVVHASEYKTGEEFRGKRVMVVGCGNSGMEIALDLANQEALPSLVCRSSVHVLPREVLGKSTFEIAVILLKWLPLWMVDKLLLLIAWLILGSLEKYGLKRPKRGPLELKNTLAKSPVLDVGALSRIRSGRISVVPGISKFSGPNSVELVDGREIDVDCVVLATGYRTNVPSWLQVNEMFDKNGNLKTTPFSSGWKGKEGLYAAGFTRRGLSGAASDAINIAFDIAQLWNKETQHISHIMPRLIHCISTSS